MAQQQMVNREARSYSVTLLRLVVEGFVRDPEEGRIYFVQTAGAKRKKIYPVLQNRTVSQKQACLPPEKHVHLLHPEELGISGGAIPFAKMPH